MYTNRDKTDIHKGKSCKLYSLHGCCFFKAVKTTQHLTAVTKTPNFAYYFSSTQDTATFKDSL